MSTGSQEKSASHVYRRDRGDGMLLGMVREEIQMGVLGVW